MQVHAVHSTIDGDGVVGTLAPRQGILERREEVEDDPGHDDVVIEADVDGDED